MSEPNMDLWSSKEIMEYRVEKLSKEVELQRAVIEAAREVVRTLSIDPQAPPTQSEFTVHAQRALTMLAYRLRDLDGGDK